MSHFENIGLNIIQLLYQSSCPRNRINSQKVKLFGFIQNLNINFLTQKSKVLEHEKPKSKLFFSNFQIHKYYFSNTQSKVFVERPKSYFVMVQERQRPNQAECLVFGWQQLTQLGNEPISSLEQMFRLNLSSAEIPFQGKKHPQEVTKASSLVKSEFNDAYMQVDQYLMLQDKGYFSLSHQRAYPKFVSPQST